MDPDFDKIFEHTHKFFNYHFALLNKQFNKASSMYSEKRYLAEASRQLIKLNSFIETLEGLCAQTEYNFSFNPEYKKSLKYVTSFMRETNGSPIPNDYVNIKIEKNKCVFALELKLASFGKVKNIIFAAEGYKPEIILVDALENNLEIVKNAEYCLVYDLTLINESLTTEDLSNWWKQKHGVGGLWQRLLSAQNEIEQKFYKSYYKTIGKDVKYPALIPQVYLHYDPKTINELISLERGVKRIHCQRMDFLILWKGKRIIIEIDGKQHYSDEKGASDPKKYSEQVAYDRKMKFLGYEIYRLGGYELMENTYEDVINKFFNDLRKKYLGDD